MAYGQSHFPESIDSFIDHLEISASDVEDVQRYQELKLKENRTVSEDDELANLTSQLRDKLLTAQDFNKLQDAIIATQKHYRDEVDGYIQTKQSEFQTEIDKFNYQNEYSSGATYNQKNIVTYNGESYICRKDGIIGVAPDPSQDTAQWAKIAEKGEKGDVGSKGDDGASLTYKHGYDPSITYQVDDLVRYEGSTYACIQETQGNLPTNGMYWEEFVSKGGGTLLTELDNRVVLSSESSNVEVGIPEYNYAEDLLSVYINSTYIKNGDDWVLGSDNVSINKVNGTWSKDTVVDFVVLKNMKQNMSYADGTLIQSETIGKEKLQIALQDEIDAKATSGEMDTLEQQFTNYKADIASQESGKGASMVGVEDSGGNFTATNIEGVLDELFTFADNGKSNIASVVGSPATASDTFNQLQTIIQNQKNTLATNLESKNVTASGTETLKSLADKVADIQLGVGTANKSDVLSGKTFSSDAGTDLTGTMANQGAYNITPSTTNQTIPEGYHNGQGIVEGDSDLVSKHLIKGINILGVVGTEPRFRQGTADAAEDQSGSYHREIRVSGLGFQPKFVFVWGGEGESYQEIKFYNAYTDGVNDSILSDWETNNRYLRGDDGVWSTETDPNTDGEWVITSDGFETGALGSGGFGVTYSWIAIG